MYWYPSKKETALCSKSKENDETEVITVNEFLLPGSVCAIAADEKSADMVWFVYIECEKEAGKDEIDSYGHIGAEGHNFICGKYLEKIGTVKGGKKFIKMDKEVFFYKENVVYPFVNVEIKNSYFTVTYMI